MRSLFAAVLAVLIVPAADAAEASVKLHAAAACARR
jgi:hypothetical protein